MYDRIDFLNKEIDKLKKVIFEFETNYPQNHRIVEKIEELRSKLQDLEYKLDELKNIEEGKQFFKK